jgi:hypothetical protein
MGAAPQGFEPQAQVGAKTEQRPPAVQAQLQPQQQAVAFGQPQQQAAAFEQPPVQAGSPVYPGAPAYPGAPTPTPAPTPAPAQQGFSRLPLQQAPLPHSPLRALILAGAAVLLIFIASFRVADLHSTSTTICFFLLILTEACALYLIVQDKPLYKIAAGTLFFVSPFFFANHTAQTVFALIARQSYYAEDSGYQVFALFNNVALLHYLLPALLFSLIIGGTGFLLSFLIKEDSKTRRMLLAGSGAAVFLVIQPLVYLVLNPGSYSLLLGFSSGILDALAFFLAFLLVGAICRIKSYDLKNSTGRKAWFWICTVFSSISLLVQSILAVSGSGDSLGFLPTILVAIGVVGYILLIGSRRMGYIVIILAIGVLFFGELSAALVGVVNTLMGSNVSSMGDAALQVGLTLTMLVNPTITGLVLMGVWNQPPAAAPYQRPKVSVLFRVTAVCSLAFGFFGALGFARGTFNLIWVPSGGYEAPTAFFTLSLICAIVGLFATLECFNPRARVRKPLLVTSVVTTVISFLTMILCVAFLVLS